MNNKYKKIALVLILLIAFPAVGFACDFCIPYNNTFYSTNTGGSVPYNNTFTSNNNIGTVPSQNTSGNTGQIAYSQTASVAGSLPALPKTGGGGKALVAKVVKPISLFEKLKSFIGM